MNKRLYLVLVSNRFTGKPIEMYNRVELHVVRKVRNIYAWKFWIKVEVIPYGKQS